MAATDNTYYIDAVNFAGATAVYLDSVLSTKAPDGWYTFGTTVRQQTTGVLGTSSACNCNVFYISGVRSTCTDFCDGTNRVINSSKSSNVNATYSTLSLGDTILGAALTNGWYAYAATSTDTATGTYKQFQITNGNYVADIKTCSGTNCITP
tara:strand:+ start:21409 stop:21864 length:456 start_codon:yes stop_codon:yes gene_type:complete